MVSAASHFRSWDVGWGKKTLKSRSEFSTKQGGNTEKIGQTEVTTKRKPTKKENR